MDKFDEIQQMWARLNERLDQLEPSIISESRYVAESNIKSARSRLMRRDKGMITLSIVCALFFPAYFWAVSPEFGFPAFEVGYWRLATVLTFFVYFATCGVLIIRKYLMLLDINIGTMSIEEISKRARMIKTCHLRSEAFMSILMIGVLVEFFWMLSYGDRGIMFAGIFGLIGGLAIAIPMFFRYLSDYRRMIYPYNED